MAEGAEKGEAWLPFEVTVRGALYSAGKAISRVHGSR